MEKWLSVPRYSNRYEVSSLGRVWSNVTNKYMRIKPGNHGYPRVNLTLNGKTEQMLVHRLVAELFLENAEKLPQVNHKDGDKTNNAASNLEWVTAKENTLHAYNELGRSGSRKGQYGEDNPRSQKYMVISPCGVQTKVLGLAQFCRDNDLESSKMYAVAKGQRAHHKGFKCEPITKAGVDPA